MSDHFQVRFIEKEEFRTAIDLCWNVFCEFEAGLFSREGAISFNQFINDELLFKAFLNGGFPVVAAYDGDMMIGVAALRYGPHLSLLFVEGVYQHMGVGTALVQYCRDWLISRDTGLGRETLTVNAAPTGEAFYKWFGFEEDGPVVSKDGVYYRPMILNLKK
ncbi:MAG: GNAT family N-acetyltransferase [Lachnospiraceae bacterium]|nr:GNAT family N-acetyltransferase [Lachnospiraceae bacterium]